jgi:hypothetical protein
MLGDHFLRHSLGHKEGAAQIDIQYSIPVFPGHIMCPFSDIAACIVDKYIKLSKGLIAVASENGL